MKRRKGHRTILIRSDCIPVLSDGLLQVRTELLQDTYLYTILAPRAWTRSTSAEQRWPSRKHALCNMLARLEPKAKPGVTWLTLRSLVAQPLVLLELVRNTPVVDE